MDLILSVVVVIVVVGVLLWLVNSFIPMEVFSPMDRQIKIILNIVVVFVVVMWLLVVRVGR